MTLPVERVREMVAAAIDEFGDDAPSLITDYTSRLDDPADVALVERVVADLSKDHWRADPARMAHQLTDGRYQRWRFIELLSRKFVDAVEGRSPFQIWTLPAQYGKSTLASQWGPAWCLDRHPDWPLILTSYGDALATKNALSVRNILRDHGEQLRCRLRRDEQRQDRFATPEGGGVLAAGIDAGITGWPARGIVVDDPFKNWQEAHSEARRQHVWDQYLSVLRLRLAEGGFIIVCQTRWHEDDLAGRLLAHAEAATGDRFELVRLPATAEEYDPSSHDPLLRTPDPLGREPGEVLEPERYGREAVEARKLALGSYLWTGMEQQRPAPEEGGELKRAWWRHDDNVPPHFDDALTSWDMKLKEKETGDFVVGQFWGRTGSSFWLCDQLRGQWNQPTTECAIALMAVRHPEARRHLVENTGNGPEVMEALARRQRDYVVSDEVAGLLGMTADEREKVQAMRRRGIHGLVPVTVKGSKVVRARAISGTIEAGNVHLAPRGAAWIPGFLDETAAFNNGAHDDQVDAMSQALARLTKGGGYAKISNPADRRLSSVSPGRSGLSLRPTPPTR